MPSFRVLVGINYGKDDPRAEPGDIVTDLPAAAAKWMLRDGIIEPAAAGTPVVVVSAEDGAGMGEEAH